MTREDEDWERAALKYEMIKGYFGETPTYSRTAVALSKWLKRNPATALILSDRAPRSPEAPPGYWIAKVAGHIENAFWQVLSLATVMGVVPVGGAMVARSLFGTADDNLFINLLYAVGTIGIVVFLFWYRFLRGTKEARDAFKAFISSKMVKRLRAFWHFLTT